LNTASRDSTMRRLTAVVVVVALTLLVSCSTSRPKPTPTASALPPPATPTGSPLSASPTLTRMVDARVRCGADDLTLRIVPWIEQIGSVNFVVLALTNTGPVPCYLIGYPKIDAIDAQGSLGLTVRRPTRRFFVTMDAPERVALAPRGIGYVLLVQRSCRDFVDRSTVRAASTIELTLPDDTAVLLVTRHTQQFDGTPVDNTLWTCGMDVDESPISSSVEAAER